MLAIPVLRSRVAPVFNWCSRILLIPEDAPDSNAGAEMILSGVSDPFERLTVLRQKGADTLICGALSPDLFHYADHLQLRIICGIAGDIEEVLQAYRSRQLDQPCFWLPGCRHNRGYRADCHQLEQQRRAGMTGGQDQSGGQNQARGAFRKGAKGGRGSGPGGRCVCPQCGATAPHTRGIPCTQTNCPQCGKPMTRQ